MKDYNSWVNYQQYRWARWCNSQ